MKNDNVIPLEKPVENEDLLTAMLRQGAKDLISRAVQAELTEFLAQYQDVVDDQGTPIRALVEDQTGWSERRFFSLSPDL